MKKYCNNPNCKSAGKTFDTDALYCPSCGTLLETPPTAERPLVSGDANAIQELHNTEGSYNTTHNINTNDSHDTHTITNVVYNIGTVDSSKQERTIRYREECKKLIKDRRILPEVREKLDRIAEDLGIDENAQRQAESAVLNANVINKKTLSRSDILILNELKKLIEENSPNIKAFLPKLDAMSEIGNDEVQFYINLVWAAENPNAYIRSYERRSSDRYWQTFWSYIAYQKTGHTKEAENALRKLDDWEEQEADNVFLLHACGALQTGLDNFIDSDNIELAKSSLRSCKVISPWLYPFHRSLSFMVQHGGGTPQLSDNPEVNFYLSRICGVRRPQLQLQPQPQPRPFSYAEAVPPAPPKIQSQPPVYNTSSGKPYKKYMLGGIAVVVLAAGYMALHRNEKPAIVPLQSETSATTVESRQTTSAQPAQAARPATATSPVQTSKPATASLPSETAKSQSSGTTAKRETTPKATARQTAQPASASAQPSRTQIEQTTSPETPVTQSAAPKPELTAAELVSKGLSAVRKFKAEEAAKYFRQAVAKGSIEAYYHLGELYYNGNGVAKSFPTARSYFEKAANAGMADAQYMMGIMARNGQGCPKNIQTARMWLQKAAAQGHAKAAQLLD